MPHLLQKFKIGASFVLALPFILPHALYAQWSSDGPYGGNVHQIITSKFDPDTLYAFQNYPDNRAALFISQNRGNNWFLATLPDHEQTFSDNYSYIVSAVSRQSLLLHTGSHSHSILWKSQDNGQSWVSIYQVDLNRISAVRSCPMDLSVIYAWVTQGTSEKLTFIRPIFKKSIFLKNDIINFPGSLF